MRDRGTGATSPDRVTGMAAEVQRVATAFASANGLTVDGFDVDIELGGVYAAGSDKSAIRAQMAALKSK